MSTIQKSQAKKKKKKKRLDNVGKAFFINEGCHCETFFEDLRNIWGNILIFPSSLLTMIIMQIPDIDFKIFIPHYSNLVWCVWTEFYFETLRYPFEISTSQRKKNLLKRKCQSDSEACIKHFSGDSSLEINNLQLDSYFSEETRWCWWWTSLP